MDPQIQTIIDRFRKAHAEWLEAELSKRGIEANPENLRKIRAACEYFFCNNVKAWDLNDALRRAELA